jgi:hypothetical protein
MIRKKAPLCKCGCGMPVLRSISTNKWNVYIQGHHSKGKTISEETKSKIRKAAKERGFFAEYNKTEEHRAKVIKSNTGRFVSEETKKKIADSVTGFTHTDEAKLKIKIARLESVGSASPSWRGGKCEYSENWVCLSPAIKKRDNDMCIYCNSAKQLKTHHIDGDKKNEDALNLITLCNSCHTVLHPRLNFLKGNSVIVNKRNAKKINKRIKAYIGNKEWENR